MSHFYPTDDHGTLANRPKRGNSIMPTTYRPTKTRVRACMACLHVHHRCTGVPCDRCFRLSLGCRPPPTSGTDVFSKPTQPLIELLLERHDGQAMAKMYMQAFGQAHREGEMDRDVVVRLLRVWRARSIVASIDVSYGLAAYISERLNVLPTEMEGEGDLAWEVPESVRRMRLVEEARRAAAAGEVLKETELFQRLDDGVTPVCLSMVSSEGIFTMAANGRFEALFRKTSDMLADTDVRKTINSFTAAAIVAPEDRETLFFNIVRLFSCRSRKKRVAFIKMLDRVDEHPRLVLFSGWQETLPDGSLVVVQRLEPVPRSRHISDVPQAMCVVKRFRSIRQIDEVLEEAAAAAAAAGVAEGGAAAVEENVVEAADGCAVLKGGGNEMDTAGKGAADALGGVRSLACVFPLPAADPQGAGIELRESIPFMLPAAAAAAARDIFKPVHLTRDIAAPPPPCPGIDCLPSPAPFLLSPLLSPLTSSSSSVASPSSSSSSSASFFSSSSSSKTAATTRLPPNSGLQANVNAEARQKKGTRKAGSNVAKAATTKKKKQKKGPVIYLPTARTTGTDAAKTMGTTTNIITSTKEFGPSTSVPLPVAPPPEALEEGMEGGEDELLLDEGLEDLEVFLNDAVMSEIF